MGLLSMRRYAGASMYVESEREQEFRLASLERRASCVFGEEEGEREEVHSAQEAR